MIDLKYSLVIEATTDPTFFGFYSPDLEGFTGVGHSIEDCLYQAKWGMEEHVALLSEQKLAVPAPNSNPTVIVQNEAELAGRLAFMSLGVTGTSNEILNHPYQTYESLPSNFSINLRFSAKYSFQPQPNEFRRRATQETPLLEV